MIAEVVSIGNNQTQFIRGIELPTTIALCFEVDSMCKWFWSLLVFGILFQHSSLMAHPGHEVSGFDRGPAHYAIEPGHGWLGTPWFSCVFWALIVLMLVPVVARIITSVAKAFRQAS